MSGKRRSIPPALVLYFLAPAIAELLSGSAPPAEFFQPFSLLVLSALYGGGALIVRETALRWGKRWPTILVLGLAYGILEEGLMVKSFFDPTWMDLGLLGIYGRWAGVNWVWAVMLTLYHTVVSIALPILLVEILYPSRRDERWLGRRGMLLVGSMLAIDVLVGYLLLTPYRPPFAPYALACITTLLLVLISRELPHRWAPPEDAPRWKPLRLGLAGFTGIGALFLAGWALPALNLPPLLTLLALLLGAYFSWRQIRRGSGEGGWDDRGRLALAGGALSFLILLAFAAEGDPARTDNPAGMVWVGLTASAGLLLLYLRVRRRSTASGAARNAATPS
jgi:multisubunit Na+/H+ antiporter MnhB subunit